MNDIDRFAQDVHRLAREKGWHDSKRLALEYHALIQSEISEATEAVRSGVVEGKTAEGKPVGEVYELADAVIRIFDYMRANGYNPSKVLMDKHWYNFERSYRHGGKHK